jgi:hypothetical protein
MQKTTFIPVLGLGVLMVVATIGALALVLYSTSCRMSRPWGRSW